MKSDQSPDVILLTPILDTSPVLYTFILFYYQHLLKQFKKKYVFIYTSTDKAQGLGFSSGVSDKLSQGIKRRLFYFWIYFYFLVFEHISNAIFFPNCVL